MPLAFLFFGHLNGMFPFLVEVTADKLSWSIGSLAMYPFIILQWLMWFRMVIRWGFFKLPIM